MNIRSEQIENFREMEPGGYPWIEIVISATKMSRKTHGFNSRLDTTEEKIHEPAERAIKISQTEAEGDWGGGEAEKLNRTSVTCGTISSDLTCN